MSTGARLLPLLSLSHPFILPSPAILPHLTLLQVHLFTLADTGLREAFSRQDGDCRPEQQSKDAGQPRAEGSRVPYRQRGGGQDPQSEGRGLSAAVPVLRALSALGKAPSEPGLCSTNTLSPSPPRQQEFILSRVSPRDGPFPCPCPAGSGLPAKLRGFNPPDFPAMRCCLL